MDKTILQNELVQYFRNGCKLNSGDIGLECEHFIVDACTLKAVSFYGENGVETIVKRLADILCVSEGERYYSNGYLIGFITDDYSVSLEPGAQVEISIKATSDISEIEKIYSGFYAQLAEITSQLGYAVVNAGYQPASKVEDVDLLPKNRYKIMDEHFKSTGSSGINMMRGTGALHVSVDYEDEADFILKYRLANLLVPIFSLISENTPVFEGVELKDDDSHLKRLQIWSDVDYERCGTVPAVFDDDFGFKKYADYILKLKPLFIPTADGKIYATGSDLSAQELFLNGIANKINFNVEDVVAHLLSMTFVDIRLKNYIEIRCADSMPIELAVPYVEMIQRLFYDKEKISAMYEEMASGCDDLFLAKNKAIDETIVNGYDAIIYGKPITYWIFKYNLIDF